MEILLDGTVIKDKETLFQSLKEQINAVDFVGNNLDALWDVLSYHSEDIVIKIKNKEQLETNLGDYLLKLLDLFKELEAQNSNVSLINVI